MSVGVERLSRRFRNEVRVKNILNERVKQNVNGMMNVRRGWETTKEVQEWGKNEEYSEWEWGTKCECYECWKWLTDYYTQRRSENEVRGLNSELVKSVWEVEAKYNCGSKYWLGLTDSTIHEISDLLNMRVKNSDCEERMTMNSNTWRWFWESSEFCECDVTICGSIWGDFESDERKWRVFKRALGEIEAVHESDVRMRWK